MDEIKNNEVEAEVIEEDKGFIETVKKHGPRVAIGLAIAAGVSLLVYGVAFALGADADIEDNPFEEELSE